MQKAVLISLGAHGLAMLLVFVSVTFRQVRYIPRETYRVRLVSAASMAAAPTAAASTAKAAPPAPTPPKEEPKQEEPKKDELAQPAEKPKPKPQPKSEQPSKQQEKPADTVPRADLAKSDTTGNDAGGAGEPGGGPPGPGDAISFDGGDFPYSAYVARMRHKIAAAWQVPAGSQTVQRSAVIYFRIHPDGDITHVSVEQPSGVFLFDQSCQRAVIESAPLAPLPREYLGEYLGVHFTFKFTPATTP